MFTFLEVVEAPQMEAWGALEAGLGVWEVAEAPSRGVEGARSQEAPCLGEEAARSQEGEACRVQGGRGSPSLGEEEAVEAPPCVPWGLLEEQA